MTSLYSLSWNDFSSALIKNYSDLKAHREFSDVTLISDDEVNFEAHKFILSTSSSFFKNILVKSVGIQPVIYLGSVSSQHLSNILNFIYDGKVEVSHESLGEFLNVAEKLKIQGLIDQNTFNEQPQVSEKVTTDSLSNPTITDEDTFLAVTVDKIKSDDVKDSPLSDMDDSRLDFESPKLFDEQETPSFPISKVDIKNEIIEETPKEQALNQMRKPRKPRVCKEPLTSATIDEETQQPFVPMYKKHKWEKIPIADMSLVEAKVNELSKKINGVWTCLWCGKTTTAYHRSSLHVHVESHFEGLKYPCDQCNKVFTTKNSIRTHLYNHKLSIENQKRWDEAKLHNSNKL